MHTSHCKKPSNSNTTRKTNNKISLLPKITHCYDNDMTAAKLRHRYS